MKPRAEQSIRLKSGDKVEKKNTTRYILMNSLQASAQIFVTGQIMVCLVINGDEIPKSQELVDDLLKIKGLASVSLNKNTEKTNVILGLECKTLWGADYIEDVLCGVKIRLSPLSFYQVNHDCAELLYNKASEYVGATGSETVLDLYCGAGTIGLSMANVSYGKWIKWTYKLQIVVFLLTIVFLFFATAISY